MKDATVHSIDPDAATHSEISELRAKREVIARAREERSLANELADKLATEKRALADEEAIDAAERDLGPIGKRIEVVRTDFGAVIVKRAHPAIFKRFIDRGKSNTKDLEELVRPCLVYPALSEFEGYVEQQPMILLRAANGVSSLAGVRAEELAGKS